MRLLSNHPLLLLPLLFSFWSCTSAPSESDPVARVNGVVITVRDYVDLFESLKPRDTNLTDQERPQIRNLVLQTLVRRAVITTAAESRNVSVTDIELQKGINKVKAGYPDQQFNESLLEGMVDESVWKERVKESLLIQKLFEQNRPQIQKPTLQEALEFFEKNADSFRRNAQAKALHIVVGDESVAKDVRQKIAGGRLRFVEAARNYSTGPEAQDSAVITVDRGVLPPPLDDFLFEGPLDQLSPVLKSSYGYHLLQVLSRSAAINQDFKAVKNQILDRLFEERRQEWLSRFEEELIRSAEIEYNRELISKL
jgi:foldase protein PrsA